jgi:hypothetical protein
MTKARSSGGTTSNKLVQAGAPKAEPKPGYKPPVGPTANVAAVGVGGGRTVYQSGSQAQHGAGVRVPPEGQERSFGPLAGKFRTGGSRET